MVIDEKSTRNLTHSIERVPLGRTGVQVSPLGLGTWQFGDRFFWSYGQSHNDVDLQEAFQTSLEAGINFFDSAEVYGLGYSERYLGKLVRALPDSTRKSLVLASKFSPLPYRVGKSHFRRALKGSLRRLGMEQLDLYQIHWPFTLRSVETWAASLAEAHQAGMIRAAGVSNFNADQTRRVWRCFKRVRLTPGIEPSGVQSFTADSRKERSFGAVPGAGNYFDCLQPFSSGIVDRQIRSRTSPSGFPERCLPQGIPHTNSTSHPADARDRSGAWGQISCPGGFELGDVQGNGSNPWSKKPAASA